MKPRTENWLKIARYDLRVAKVSLTNRLYLQVFESCHSSLEKLIKGIIYENKEKQPPKIHDLLRLMSLAMIKQIDDDIKNTLDKLNDIYFMARYPDDFEEVTAYLSKETATDTCKKTERIFKWLEKKLK